MAINTALLSDYAWADIAKAAKTAMLSSAIGGKTLSINGRDIMRLTMQEAIDLYAFAQSQITRDNSPDDGGIILAEFR